MVQIFKLWYTRKYVANFGQICSTKFWTNLQHLCGLYSSNSIKYSSNLKFGITSIGTQCQLSVFLLYAVQMH